MNIDNHLTLKKRLVEGQTLQGMFISEFRSPSMGLILHAVGFDFAIIDMEHGAFALNDLSAIIPNFRALKTQPLVRIPTVQRDYIQPLLDLGAAGLVLPMVENPDEVRRCVEMMKYPPDGRRGMSFGPPHGGFVPRDRDEYIRLANDNLLMVAMIETTRGIENLDAILDVPGLDVVMVGSYDLAIFMGEQHILTSSPLHDAMRYVLQTALTKGIIRGGNFGDPALVAEFLDLDVRFITLGGEIDHICDSFRNAKQTLDRTLQTYQKPKKT